MVDIQTPSNEVYKVSKSMLQSCYVRGDEHYDRIHKFSCEHNDEFWAKTARTQVSWFKDFDQVREGGFEDGSIAWFLNGKLNASYNCLDRHVRTRGDEVAIIWEGNEPDDIRRITYRQALKEVCRIANAMKAVGVKKGDRVALYMPMVPEAAFAMLACARLGAIHMVVFAGFSAQSLADRILDAGCEYLFTADEGLRAKKVIPLKKIADDALKMCPIVKHCFVLKRTGGKVPFVKGRDIWLHEAVAKQRAYCPAEPMDSEDILFFLHTSGSTGKPKGLAHATGGYMVYTSTTHKYIFDSRPGDVYACVADIGWITGHSYIVYGPLCNGATTFMFESTPTYPNASRYWDMVERHKINVFYTAPTALRALMRYGDEPVKKHDLSSLRILGSVGEPINPEAWRWYYNVVGGGKCSIVDTYWQTETGGIIVSPFPGATPMKPGACARPFFGVEMAIVNEKGKEIKGNNVTGVLALKRPWPGLARTIHGDHARFVKAYMSVFPGYYFTGDRAIRDKDGTYWVTGRTDDVMNVSGHRIGSAEVESALVEHKGIAEAAVVGIPHAIKGQGLVAYVTPKKDCAVSGDQLVRELNLEIRKAIGGHAIPEMIVSTLSLPKTRSGKIMRRLLRKIGELKVKDLGDTTTLADPSVVDELIEKVKNYKKPSKL